MRAQIHRFSRVALIRVLPDRGSCALCGGRFYVITPEIRASARSPCNPVTLDIGYPRLRDACGLSLSQAALFKPALQSPKQRRAHDQFVGFRFWKQIIENGAAGRRHMPGTVFIVRHFLGFHDFTGIALNRMPLT